MSSPFSRMRRIPPMLSRITSNSSSSVTARFGTAPHSSRLPGSRIATLGSYNITTTARQKSSSTSILNFPIPATVQESVKSSILDKVTQDDSKVWSTTTADDSYHRHPPQRHGHDLSPRSNDGQVSNGHHHQYSTNSNHLQPQENNSNLWDHGGVNDPIASSSKSPSATARIWHHHDPLDDLLLENETTQYWPALPPGVRSMESADPFVLAKADVESLSQSIREDLLGTDHPVLNQAASYFFGTADGGKKVRPLMVMLLSRALADATMTYQDVATVEESDHSLSVVPMNGHGHGKRKTMFTPPLSWQRHDLPQAQRRLAEISEMIHTASLFHDDVIDGSETRRGNPAVHMAFGNKMAILAGDYLLARASISLARLRHVEVVETMSTIIEHLVRGEVMQMRGNVAQTNGNSGGGVDGAAQQRNERMIYYLKKNYYKTGSLMANSCKSAALLADCPQDLVLSAYQYGKHVGMAFQLVDDVLDFEGDVASMGKPALADLRAGLSTAPVLFAAEEYPELEIMMDRKFRQDGDVEQAREWVLESAGMERTKRLARVHAERAMQAVLSWEGSHNNDDINNTVYRDALINLAYKVVERTK